MICIITKLLQTQFMKHAFAAIPGQSYRTFHR